MREISSTEMPRSQAYHRLPTNVHAVSSCRRVRRLAGASNPSTEQANLNAAADMVH
jgi:hypothetical protein